MSNGKVDFIQKEVLHPYYGYTTDTKTRVDGCLSDNISECYTRVKMNTDSVFPKRSDDKLIVGVLGGSVAVGTTNISNPKWSYKSLLGQLPEYQGKEIIVYRLNAGGLRQPQQAMMLNYYYLLGAEFDLLISLDGFNDVAIPAYDYRSNGTHPSYPRSWAHRVTGTVSKELVDLLAEKQNLQNAHRARAGLMSNSWLKHSPISNLLWTISHINYSGDLSKVDQAVLGLNKPDLKQRDFNYEALGPDYEFTSWDNLHQYSVDLWARSSYMISSVAAANGAKYLHFLQPNQYIEGSKPIMSEAEKRVAFIADIGFGNLYKKIYPRIQKKIPWLRQRGIEFHDLTYLYKDIEEPLYIDNCCHVSSYGYSLMIEKIVETIHKSNISDSASSPVATTAITNELTKLND